MSYTIRRGRVARQDIRNFIRHLKQEANEAIAQKYFDELEYDLTHLIADNPHLFNWFHETGSPYRSKLFKLARTTYWIVYVVNEEDEAIELVRFWNSSRAPGSHGL